MRTAPVVLLVLASACDATNVATRDADPDARPGDPLADASIASAPPDAAPADAGPPPPYGVQRPVTLGTTDGFDAPAPYGFYEYLPSRYAEEPDRDWPLAIFLYGIGEVGNGTTDLPDLLDTGLPQVIALSETHPTWDFTGHDRFVVISPQRDGYFGPDHITALLAWVKRNYRIDETRMYLTGLSYGAVATWDYGRTKADAGEFAAFVPIAGNRGVPAGQGCDFKHVPVWAFHGETDANGPTPDDATILNVAEINACDPDVPAKATIFPGLGHVYQVWNGVYGESLLGEPTIEAHAPFDQAIWDWMLEHRRD
jgi:predicted peptidase